MLLTKAILLVSAAVLATEAAIDKEPKNIEWVGGNFEWPCESTKSIYVSSGRYTKKNILATRGAIYKDNAILALPRFKSGVPLTLASVSLNQKGCEAVMKPFPCISAQEEGNCQALQSVVDLVIDQQDVLWALDSGVVKTMETPVRHCPPKVVAISMKTGKNLKTLDLSGLVNKASRLQYIQVEYSENGSPYVYVTDAATRSILVFDVANNRAYRVVLPKAVTAGCGRRDVLYMVLVTKGCGKNFLVFSYLCSGHVFSIRTDYLRSGSCAGHIVDLGVKPRRMIFLSNDLGSAIFFRYEGKPEVYRWDANTDFKPANFQVVYRSPDCLLATDAMADVKKERIRILESNFPDFIQNTVGCGAVQQINVMGGCV